MPNHIYTTATIFGPTDVLDKIFEIAENATDKASVLEHYLPLPADALETRTRTKADGTTETYQVFSDTGYSTALDLWGSKWADYELELVCDDRTDTKPSLTLRFQSAWGPVVEGYRKLSGALGLDAVLSYEDECSNFLGASAIADGQIVFEAYIDGSTVDEHPTFADVPAQPDEVGDEWDTWQEAFSEAWNDLLVKCEDDAFTALGNYRDGIITV